MTLQASPSASPAKKAKKAAAPRAAQGAASKEPEEPEEPASTLAVSAHLPQTKLFPQIHLIPLKSSALTPEYDQQLPDSMKKVAVTFWYRYGEDTGPTKSVCLRSVVFRCGPKLPIMAPPARPPHIPPPPPPHHVALLANVALFQRQHRCAIPFKCNFKRNSILTQTFLNCCTVSLALCHCEVPTQMRPRSILNA